MSTPSFERSIESRFFPKLSLRSIMALVTSLAVIAWLGRLAWLGYSLPWAIIATLLSVVVFLVAGGLFFLIAWIPARIAIRSEEMDQAEGSPFAANQLPPQILPPRDN